RVAALCMERTGRRGIVGDADPMDICVLTERPISHGDVLVEAGPVGGPRMLGGDQADHKIVAVLKNDAGYGAYADIAACPRSLLDRLRHYFLSYKEAPDRLPRRVDIKELYR